MCTSILIRDDYRGYVGGVCIDDVVKCLAHNKPLTCAIEASDYIDAYSEGQKDYESGAVSDRLNVTTLLTYE